MPGRGLTLLSLDGGGVRGLSSLQILKVMMERVAKEKGLSEPPKPCEFFDMIGGTSTGGLIAIMLGHLGMTTDECIAAYLTLAKTVFNKIRRLPVSTGFSSKIGDVKARFDSKELENAVKQILREQGRDEEELLYDKNNIASCKVFVTALLSQDKSRVLLTNYETPRQDSDRLDSVKIWQAVRATSAATSFFEPLTIRMGPGLGYAETFTDGGTGMNNPVNMVWNEACDVFLGPTERLEDNLDSLISIGTGEPFKAAFGSNLKDIAESLIAIATETKETAEMFQHRHSLLDAQGVYGRFNVVNGLQSVSLEEHKKFDTVMAATKSYLKEGDTHAKLQRCLGQLKLHESFKQIAPAIHNDERALTRVRFMSLRTSVGCGKTILASSIINHLRNLQTQHLSPVIHFYCASSIQETSTFSDVTCALIGQLFKHRRNLRLPIPIHIEDKLQRMFGGVIVKHSDYDLEETLLDLLKLFPGTMVVIDGIQDLADQDVEKLLVALNKVSKVQPDKSSKVVILSRESLGTKTHLDRYFDESTQLHITLDHLKQDIDVFVDYEILKKQRKQCVTDNEQLVDEIRRILKSKSEKMFLWIRIQISIIWGFCQTDTEIRKMIDELPEELEDVYIRCLDRVEASAIAFDEATPRGLRTSPGRISQREIAINTFRWAVCALGPLSIQQTREIISLRTDTKELDNSLIVHGKPTDFCGNLLEFDFAGRELRCIHSSVKKLLTSPDALPAHLHDYVVRIDIVNEWCGAICMAFIKANQFSRTKIQGHLRDVGTQLQKSMSVPKFAQSLLLGSRKIMKFSSGGMQNAESIQTQSGTREMFAMGKWHIADYIKEHWLQHTSKLEKASKYHQQFVEIVQRGDISGQPWATIKGDEIGHLRRLTQHAVVLNHLTLLRHALAIIGRRNLQAILEEPLVEGALLAIHHASFFGYLDAVMMLADHCSISLLDLEHNDAAIWAAKGGQIHVLDFIYLNTSTETMLRHNVNEENVLTIAVIQGDTNLVRHCSRLHPDNIISTNQFSTALKIAFSARSEMLEILWILLEIYDKSVRSGWVPYESETRASYDAERSDSRIICCLAAMGLLESEWGEDLVVKDRKIQRQMQRSDFFDSYYFRSIIDSENHNIATTAIRHAIMPFISPEMVERMFSWRRWSNQFLTSQDLHMLWSLYRACQRAITKVSISVPENSKISAGEIMVICEIILLLDDTDLLKLFASHSPFEGLAVGDNMYYSLILGYTNLTHLVSRRPTPWAMQWVLKQPVLRFIDHREHGVTPLRVAAERGYTEVVFLLLLASVSSPGNDNIGPWRYDVGFPGPNRLAASNGARSNGFETTASFIDLWSLHDLGLRFSKFLQRPEIKLSILSTDDWPKIMQLFEYYRCWFPNYVDIIDRWEPRMYHLMPRTEIFLHRFPQDFVCFERTRNGGCYLWSIEQWQRVNSHDTKLSEAAMKYGSSSVLGSDEWWAKVVRSSYNKSAFRLFTRHSANG